MSRAPSKSEVARLYKSMIDVNSLKLPMRNLRVGSAWSGENVFRSKHLNAASEVAFISEWDHYRRNLRTLVKHPLSAPQPGTSAQSE